MGDERGLRTKGMNKHSRIAIVIVSLLCGASVGCSMQTKQEAQQRALLMPPPPVQKFNDELKKRELFDAHGELLPSDETVAGLQLPRGLTLQRKFENEWYFESQVAPAAALDRYVSSRLKPLEVDRGNGFVAFKQALVKADPKARALTVRISAVTGSSTASEVYIKQAELSRKYVSGDEAEAQLRARREFAD